MKKLTNTFKKILVLLIGVPVTGFGLVLIPLPGPGVLITLVGLFILGLEFSIVKKHSDTLRFRLKEIIKKQNEKYQKRLEDIERN